jgi:maltose-binding protein MalE
MNNDSPTEEVETNLPEVPAKRRPMPKIDQGMNLWTLAKAHLDKIIKEDVSRKEALNKAIEYCKNRIENNL